jgi:thiamine kinase-like enzyme
MMNAPHLENNHRRSIDLSIIDWELVQLGRRAYDLGQMIGDLYERKHFTRDDSALHIIRGFIAGYGVSSDVEAFRIAIHVGQHLICWYIRRNPHAPFTEPLELIQALIYIGTNFILKGWEKDRKWFESSDLVYLFKRV